MIYIVAAHSSNWAIGKDGDIPWHLSEDLSFFRIFTRNTVVIMGRRTWESLPAKFRPLPDRVNIVITSTPIEGVETYPSLHKALMVCRLKYDCNINLIGGQRIYEEGLQYADRLVLTHVFMHIKDADAFFPNIDRDHKDKWRIIDESGVYQQDRPEVSADPILYRRYIWVRSADIEKQ